MNIASTNQMSSVMPTNQANQSNQDSHEKNIQNQIVSLQGKMRDLAYNTEMSTDEKSDKKKKLQEQIQNLNSELKQYKIQKRREEAEKRQNETEKSDENNKSSSPDESAAKNSKETVVSNTFTSSDGSNSVAINSNIRSIQDSRDIDNQAQADEPEFGLNVTESEMMVSFSNTQKQIANMEKIQTNLTGLMRTAETDEEKLKLQKKIDSVSNIIEDKAKKTADKLEESREEDKKKKEKIRKMLKEQEERRANMKAAVPKSSKGVLGDNKDGKVLLTRKKS